MPQDQVDPAIAEAWASPFPSSIPSEQGKAPVDVDPAIAAAWSGKPMAPKKKKGPKYTTKPGLSLGTLLGIDTPEGMLPAESTGGSGALAGYLGDPISAPPAINPHMKSRVPEGIVDRLFNPVETMVPILGPTSGQWKERMAPGGQAARDWVSTNISQPGSGLFDAAFPSKELPFPRISEGVSGEEYLGTPPSHGMDLGVAANYASGVPGALASTGTDIATGMAEQAPELVGMNASGKWAKEVGVFDQLAKGVHGVENFVQTGLGGRAPSLSWPGFQLTHNGGFLPQTAESRLKLDFDETKSRDAAARMVERMNTADTGVKLPLEERKWMGMLIQQPRIRAVLRELHAIPTDISAYLSSGPARLKPTMESLGVPTPGIVNAEAEAWLASQGLTAAELPILKEAIRMPTPGSLGKVLDDIVDNPGANTSTELRRLLKSALSESEALDLPKKIKAAVANMPERIKGQIANDVYPADAATIKPGPLIEGGGEQHWLEKLLGFPSPERPMPKPRDFARVTDDAAAMLDMTKRELQARALLDPSHAAEFTDFAYSPLMFAGKEIPIFPAGNSYNAVRGANRGYAKARKVLTEAWRKAHGIIEDPAAPFAKRYIQEMHEINTDEYLRSIVMTPGAMVGADVLPGAEAGARKMIGSTLYQKMPTDQKFKMISGQWVRAQEAEDAVSLMRERGFWTQFGDSLGASWRFGMTVLNPMTGNRNLVTNILQAHSYGLPFWDLKTYNEVGKDMARNGPISKALRDSGATWMVGGTNTGLADTFNEAGMTRNGATNAIQDGFLKMSRMMRDNPASNWVAEHYYGPMDKQVKSALAWKLHTQGMSLTEAIGTADRALVAFDKMPKFVNKLRGSLFGIPFISWDYGQAQNMINLAIENPAMFKRASITLDAINEAAFQNIGATDQEREDIKNMYQGKLYLVQPFRAALATPIVWNVTPWNPYQNLTNAVRSVPTGVKGALQYPLQVAQNLVFRNPVANIGAGLLSGVNPQTGAELAPPLGSGASMGDAMSRLGEDPTQMDVLAGPLTDREIQGRSEFLSQSVLPPVLGGRVWQNVEKAGKGIPNVYGRTTTVPQALIEGMLTGKPMRLFEDQANMSRKLKAMKGKGKKALKGSAKEEAMTSTDPSYLRAALEYLKDNPPQ